MKERELVHVSFVFKVMSHSFNFWYRFLILEKKIALFYSNFCQYLVIRRQNKFLNHLEYNYKKYFHFQRLIEIVSKFHNAKVENLRFEEVVIKVIVNILQGAHKAYTILVSKNKT